MEPAWIAAGFAGLALAMNFVVTIWRGGKTSATNLTKMESRLTQSIAEVERNLESRQEAAIKMYGESISAIREQMRLNEKETIDDINDIRVIVKGVEIWARDEFVRKESFREVATDMKNTMLENMRNVNAAVQSVRDAITAAIMGKSIKQDGRAHDIG